MDTDKLTVLIFGNDDQDVKSFNINRNLIINYKKYLKWIAGGISALALIFLIAIGYALKTGYDKNGLLTELNSANEKLGTYDSLQLSQKLSTIDNNLDLIDGYLQKRGVLEQGNAGGEPGGGTVVSNIEKIKFLEKQSVVFYNTIKEIPVGYPYYGLRSSDYGYRRNPFGGFSSEFHAGVDIKGPVGDPIFATGEGTVNRCDYYGGYGNAVVIDHKNGIQSLYGHLSAVNVITGQQIKAGDVIGFLGSTGRSTGPHVHYEIRKNGEDIDPEPFLSIIQQ